MLTFSNGLAVGLVGNTYVAGTTYSSNFSTVTSTSPPFSVNTAGQGISSFIGGTGYGYTTIALTGVPSAPVFLQVSITGSALVCAP